MVAHLMSLPMANPQKDQTPIKHQTRIAAPEAVVSCVNSDTEPCFGYNLTQNLLKLAEVHDLSEETLVEIMRNPFVYNFSGGEHIAVVDAWLKENGYDTTAS